MSDFVLDKELEQNIAIDEAYQTRTVYAKCETCPRNLYKADSKKLGKCVVCRGQGLKVGHSGSDYYDNITANHEKGM